MKEKGQYVHHDADEHDRHGSISGFAVLPRIFQHLFEHDVTLPYDLISLN